MERQFRDGWDTVVVILDRSRRKEEHEVSLWASFDFHIEPDSRVILRGFLPKYKCCDYGQYGNSKRLSHLFRC